jgi:hypothetical protein
MIEDVYLKGYIDGLVAYAHWEDGRQYVGTSGTLLSDAIIQAQEHWNFNPPRPSNKATFSDVTTARIIGKGR